MYQAFELLRRAAEACRDTTRQTRGEIDPVSWEALLDRVEDQLDEGDRDDYGVSEPTGSLSLNTCSSAPSSASAWLVRAWLTSTAHWRREAVS